MRDIEVLYVPGCPNVTELVDRLRDVACGAVDIRQTELDPNQPAPPEFSGSPCVLIDGTNPFKSSEAPDMAACSLAIPDAADLKRALDPLRQ